MNILFTVCGRAGSKGVKNKNYKLFMGVPLLYYTLAAIELYKEQFDDNVYVCINTDSEELAKLALNFSKDLSVIPRSEELAGEKAAKMPVIQECLNNMTILKNMSFDCVVDLDITSPIRTVEHIYSAITKQKNEKFDLVFSVTEARRNPYFNMVKLNSDGSCEKVIQSNYTARQQAPILYDMNASIYSYDPEFLKNNCSGMLFDARCGLIEMPDTGVLDIDSEEDFKMLEVIAGYLININPAFRSVANKAKV